MSASDFLKVASLIIDGFVAISLFVGLAIKAAATIVFTVFVTKMANKWLDSNDEPESPG